jgi:hypothetical protein
MTDRFVQLSFYARPAWDSGFAAAWDRVESRRW